jgi:hypothetical protein
VPRLLSTCFVALAACGNGNGDDPPSTMEPQAGGPAPAVRGSCRDDSDCEEGSCVVGAAPVTYANACSDGLVGSPCNDGGDCRMGMCGKIYTRSVTGTCTDGSAGNTCSAAEQCADGLTCLMPADTPIYGECTGGEVGHPCYDDSDCNDGRCLGSSMSDLGRCSDGAVGKVCDNGDDGDCADGRCAPNPEEVFWMCTAGEVGDYCRNASHCVDSECVLSRSGIGICSDAALGAACASDEDCDSARCLLPAPGALGTCVDGLDGSTCNDDDDCVSSRCARGPGGGMCTDGSLTSVCAEHTDCESQICVHYGSEYGECGDGLPGSPCYADQCIDGAVCASLPEGGQCTDRQLGSICAASDDCASAHCYRPDDGDFGTCSAGEAGDPCDSSPDCASRMCMNGMCR